jgi:hypothetical protein
MKSVEIPSHGPEEQTAEDEDEQKRVKQVYRG